jgi:hypothetical protein
MGRYCTVYTVSRIVGTFRCIGCVTQDHNCYVAYFSDGNIPTPVVYFSDAQRGFFLLKIIIFRYHSRHGSEFSDSFPTIFGAIMGVFRYAAGSFPIRRRKFSDTPQEVFDTPQGVYRHTIPTHPPIIHLHQKFCNILPTCN